MTFYHLRNYLILAIIALTLHACFSDDDLITDPDARIEFSLDTLRFDTVFTEQGSATRILKLYNPNDQTIEIDRIYVGGGDNSSFRFNIDGISGNEARNIQIKANDSLYIFGEVTVDPDQPLSISPFVIEDQMLFDVNGETQSVLLEAWGQNANYIPSRFGGGGQVALICNGGEVIWDDPKPYVIFGIVVIDDCTLRVPAGAKIYVHGGLQRTFVPDPENPNDSLRIFYNDGRIIVNNRGRLIVEGTQEEPVVIQGDRLEPEFSNVSGQWFGIVMLGGSKGNVLEYTTVKNSILGIAVDSAAELSMKNSQIYNTSSNGVLGVRSSISAENCLFYNNGTGAIRTVYGGNYNFDYCTVGSYGVDAEAISLSNALCLDNLCTMYRANPLNAQFRNCIVSGSRRDELGLYPVPDAAFNYSFQNCALRIDELDDNEPFLTFREDCENCVFIENGDALFVNLDEDDYHLDTLSVVEEKAMPLSGIELDLDGEMRDGVMPDIGCYEYIDK